jgi:hypothetical protein
MPLFKANITVPTKDKTSVYAHEWEGYTEASDLLEAATKFTKYAKTKKGKVEGVYEANDRSVIV